jgi:hypothetical protein
MYTHVNERPRSQPHASAPGRRSARRQLHGVPSVAAGEPRGTRVVRDREDLAAHWTRGADGRLVLEWSLERPGHDLINATGGRARI